MTGTFSSLGIAASALRYNRVAMDVASNNIANAGTTGFVRRRIEADALGAPSQAAMWSRYDGVGSGVDVGGVTRMTDPFLDARSRREHGQQAYLDTRVAVLDRVESAIGEPGDNGVAAAMNDFRSSWQNLVSHPEVPASRTQVISAARSVADALNVQASHVEAELGDQRGHTLDLVVDVNTAAADLAELNRSIVAARVTGTDHGDLLDQRDLLALHLAETIGAVAKPQPDGSLDLSVGGVSLVTGSQASRLSVTAGIAADGSADGSALAFALTSPSGTTPLAPGALGGDLRAVAELISTTLPQHLAGLDAVATQLADSVNALHTAGYDRDGNAGQPMFTYSTATGAARSLGVAISDPDAVAASGRPGGGLDTATADAIGDLTGHDAAYQRLINDFGSTVVSANRLGATQRLLTTQVDSSREQLAGVSIDEETISLLAAQRSFEAASRVLTTLDDMLDTLINRTGVTR